MAQQRVRSIFTLPPELVDELKLVAEKSDRPASRVVERALERYLAESWVAVSK